MEVDTVQTRGGRKEDIGQRTAPKMEREGRTEKECGLTAFP